MSGYRKRFVIFNMALISVVLVIVFVALGVYMYNSYREELKNTLMHVIMPISEPNENFHTIDELSKPPFERGEKGEPPSDIQTGEKPVDDRPPISDKEPPQNDRRESDDKNIMTVFYNIESEEISVLSKSEGISAIDIEAAVKEIASLAEQYGELDGYGLIYFKEVAHENVKIAIAQKSYVGSKMAVSAIWLSVIFVLSLGVFFGISVWLSKRAAAPMENAVKMERDFVANISHDLKTPITVILANNSIIRQNPESSVSEQEQWIDSTDEAAKSMMKMINEMLTLSSLESLGKKITTTPVDLSKTVEKSVLQMESVAYDKGISLTDDIAAGVIVTSVPEYTERICNSLIENALKYEARGGRVEVTLSSSKKKAALSVKNAGSYIEPDDIPHIFERFYRADKARTEHGGHGLGLPIIKEMAERVGAEISVVSSRDDGTLFTVTFPLCE
ncbi:MAG: HAMP domain-containing histidine kinase [Clostridia bacterium]|nr:HAMP domain-containing histidine kinase [Clostridia bacterium]